jgi:hypothetical protein
MKKTALWTLAAAGLLWVFPWALQAQVVLSNGVPNGGEFRAGTLPLRWETGGPRCAEMPEWQVHEYNPDLYILRQSGCTDFEKPFVFLLFGGERALLLDTGSRKGNLAPTLQLVMHRWRQPPWTYSPHDIVSIAVYDRQTAILFTGDSVYPGRLYIRDLAAFEKSNQRMLRFTEGKPVAHLLGNHIEEQRTPYTDYPVRTEYQPDEHEWALSRGTLFEIQAGLEAMHGKPQRVAFRDFTLWPTEP